MTLAFALMTAADYYRYENFTPEFAGMRIAEIRELAREHGVCEPVIDTLIPAMAPKYEIAPDEYLP